MGYGGDQVLLTDGRWVYDNYSMAHTNELNLKKLKCCLKKILSEFRNVDEVG